MGGSLRYIGTQVFKCDGGKQNQNGLMRVSEYTTLDTHRHTILRPHTQKQKKRPTKQTEE